MTEDWIAKNAIADRLKADYDKGVGAGMAKVEGLREELDALKGCVARFETDSGVKINDWSYGHIGRAVRDALECGPERIRQQVQAHRAWAQRVVEECDRRLAADGSVIDPG